MSSIPSIRRFNWVSKPTAWQSAQTWRERQQAARANFEATNSGASSVFANAATSFVTGMGDITIQVAAKRIQAEHAAKAVNTRA
jgi:hypothetical protein